jgi:uncharacterized protein (TIGR00730 family)
MNQIICVFASSSDAVDGDYRKTAVDLGKALAKEGYQILFGGGKVGLMGELARAAFNKTTLIGVIPGFLFEKGLAFSELSEIVITEDMKDRKTIMRDRSDAYIALPGGIGTIEELIEVITLKQLQQHNKPIIIFNINHVYDPLLTQFKQLIGENFIKPNLFKMFYTTTSVEDAIAYLKNYIPPKIEDKWFTNQN